MELVPAIAWRHVDWLHQSQTGSPPVLVPELRCSLLLQGHWCRSNILFTDLTIWNKNFVLLFFFQFLSILFFLYELEGRSPQRPPLETASARGFPWVTPVVWKLVAKDIESPWATPRWCKVRDPTVISFESMPTCDERTDGQTRRPCSSIAERYKNVSFVL